MGSPYYMSPEQIQGKDVNFHTDMYSLGVVLYELLLARKPFIAENLEALMQKIIKYDPVPPTEVRKDLPKEIDRVVLRALAKTPEQRYPTWAEFALALSKVGQSVLPPDAIPDSEKYVALKSVPMLAGLSDADIWELARAGRWTRMAKNRAIVREKEKGTSFYFLAAGDCKVTRQGRLLNMVDEREFFGEMAYIWGGKAPRHATIEAATDLLVAEFEAEAVAKMSEGAQLHLTRALARNLADRLELANTRLGR